MTTALYRRYRPDTFQDVIGQDHVTAPLMAALRGDRVTHAYLFSGPRGCGKTTSARILARCLNCEQAPTDTPCGVCPSCRDLATGGPGSLDVVEIDAASHNGVDDARDLRERAAFAPARDRYKIFILDEAHMVTPQGFNALLKLVEEPPAHVKFIFATTEPEKVIGTIRSRTHHYPFRLVPPDILEGYLAHLCDAEGVDVGPGVFPLVTRAGGGSVRDTLSVMDQLIGGAVDSGVDYERAVALLGYTDATMLDQCVDAIAAGDGAGVFRVVDRVVASGHDPRRFVEDLLQRLRDLLVIALAGAEAGPALGSLPADQFERMEVQARTIGSGALSRSADMTAQALGQMVGATSPRLQLELLMARLLVPAVGGAGTGAGAFGPTPGARPAADTGRPAGGQAQGGANRDSAGGARARAARIAQRASGEQVGGPAAQGAQGVSDAAVASGTAGGRVDQGAADAFRAPGDSRQRAAQAGRADSGAQDPQAESAQPTPAAEVPGWGQAVQPGAGRAAGGGRSGSTQSRAELPQGRDGADRTHAQAPGAGAPEATWQEAPEVSAVPGGASANEEAASGGGRGGSEAADAEMIRTRWAEVLDAAKRSRRATWALVEPHAQPGTLSEGVFHVLFTAPGLVGAFENGGHGPILADAIHQALGLRLEVHGILAGGDGGPGAGGSGGPGGPGAGGPGGPGAGGPGGPGAGGPGGAGGRGSGGAGEQGGQQGSGGPGGQRDRSRRSDQRGSAGSRERSAGDAESGQGPDRADGPGQSARHGVGTGGQPARSPEARTRQGAGPAGPMTAAAASAPGEDAYGTAGFPYDGLEPPPLDEPPFDDAPLDDLDFDPLAPPEPIDDWEEPAPEPAAESAGPPVRVAPVHEQTPSTAASPARPAGPSPAGPPPRNTEAEPASPSPAPQGVGAGPAAASEPLEPMGWGEVAVVGRSRRAQDRSGEPEPAPVNPAAPDPAPEEPPLATVHRLHALPDLPGGASSLHPAGKGMVRGRSTPEPAGPQSSGAGEPVEPGPISAQGSADLGANNDRSRREGEEDSEGSEDSWAPPSASVAAAIAAARAAARGEAPPPSAVQARGVALEDDVISEDDEDAEEAGVVGLEVVKRLLGATVLEEVVVTEGGH